MSRIRSWVASEKERHALWLPVLFAIGIALYFALPHEPPPRASWRLLAASLVLLAATFHPRAWHLKRVAYAAIFVASGFWMASQHTIRYRQPVVAEALSPRPVKGTVEVIERTEHGVRFTLSQLTIAGHKAEQTPERIRISVRPKKGHTLAWPHIGDRIWIMAGLMPPMGPALPNGFDFSRYFFFRDIGAVGYGLPPWRVIENDKNPSILEQFEEWRFALTDRIINALGATHGPIAAGLITGEARAISETDFEALKASNLYHIIAISGGHMVVIAGVIFGGLRLLMLALPGGYAARRRGKSIAAVATLILVTLYLAVTGMPISAVRAYIMIALVLIAVIAARRGDPMRALMVTFGLMLLIDPSDLLEPGFQLSFAATLAIVALVEGLWFRPPMALEESWRAVFMRVMWMSLLITVAAQIATTPLAIAIFNNYSTYGLLANMIATPLVTFFLMPTVALFFLLLPVGLESMALTLIHTGITALLAIAHWVASFPQALLYVPSLPWWGLALFALGLLWLCLWQRRPRLLGIVPMIVGSLSLWTVDLPDLLIGAQAKQIAVRTEHGFMQVKGRSNAMIPELWAHGVGQDQLLPRDKTMSACEGDVCFLQINDTTIAYAKSSRKPLQSCVDAEIIITTAALECPNSRVIYAGNQPQALWFASGRLESSGDWQGARPWRATVLEADDA